ncbi:MAG: hypothetical protein WC343_02255 [Bacilli bacterium]|jgi:hypothetical protein
MDRRDRNLIVRLPNSKWMGIDELKQIRVDVADPVRCQKIGGIKLDDLLRKTR